MNRPIKTPIGVGNLEKIYNSLNNNIPLNILLESGINRSILRGRHNV
jgi:hypothetical protein